MASKKKKGSKVTSADEDDNWRKRSTHTDSSAPSRTQDQINPKKESGREQASKEKFNLNNDAKRKVDSFQADGRMSKANKDRNWRHAAGHESSSERTKKNDVRSKEKQATASRGNVKGHQPKGPWISSVDSGRNRPSQSRGRNKTSFEKAKEVEGRNPMVLNERTR